MTGKRSHCDSGTDVAVHANGTTNGSVNGMKNVEAKSYVCNNNMSESKLHTPLDLDRIAPATGYTSCRPDGTVKLRITGHGYGSEKPRTVPSALRDTVTRVGDSIALAVKRNGQWIHWTWNHYHTDVMKAAKSFIKLGLSPSYSVGILGFNAPEWFISDLGAIFAGGLAVGYYTTSTPEAIQFIAVDARSQIIVVENDMQLQKILKIRSQLPHLKAIIQYTGDLIEKYDGVMNWEDFMAVGRSVSDAELESRMRTLAPNKCCTLIYTSGTTGNPKGVMMSHDNLTWTAVQSQRSMEHLVYGAEIGVSYLPLSHVAAQILDIYIPMTIGCSVYFAQPDALKGSLVETLKEVRPTVFLGVPRVWEKMQERMLEVGRQNTGLKKTIAEWAKAVGLRGSYAKMEGQPIPWNFNLANALVFKKVKAALGFNRCKVFMTAAAPIMKQTLDYFMSLNIPIFEIYGMSECSGPHTVSGPSHYYMGSVGTDLPGIFTKIDNPDADANGEVCMGGRHVMMGYLNQEEKTEQTIDDDGFLHSEDIGHKDAKGFLFITGRIKEIIITAGGENVAPTAIEDAVKESLPCVSNCMVIGDKRKFLSLLIALKTVVNSETMEPTDELAYESLDLCRTNGCKFTKLSELLESKNGQIYATIQAGITKANKRAVSNAARIAKWELLPRDFSIPGGELGPTLKVRRPIVTKMYEPLISSLYADV